MTLTVDPTPEPAVSRTEQLRVSWDRFSGWVRGRPEWLLVGLFLAALMIVSVLVRGRTLGGQYWMDEAITVGIASHPLSQIPGIMRMDGSPPLFYMLLHVWISMFGDSERATHMLSLIIGTLTIPAGYWAARSLVGKRAAIFAAILFATNAYLTGYSEETRMYELMAMFGLLGTVGFVNGFVHRRRGYIVLFTVSEALMLYTHSWGLFYGVAAFVSLVILWFISGEAERRHFIRDGVLAFTGIAILYAPWIPNFIYQATHTGAPWDPHPRFGAPVQIAQGVMGGFAVAIAAFVFAAIGVWGLLGRKGRQTREARVMFMLVSLAVFTLAFGWIASQVTPAWVLRYFAPVVAPILLVLALGLARARVLGILGVIIACAALLHPSDYAPPNKSDMRDIAGELAPMLHPGDLVVVGQPEQTPLAYYYLPAGLRWANTMGPVKDPSFMNWVDAMKRYQDAKPAKVLPPLLKSLKPCQQLLYIQPLTEGNSNWTAPWTQLVRLRSAQWGAIIAADKQLVPEAWAPHDYAGATTVADSAVLYKRVC